MNISVIGQHIEVSTSLQGYVKEKVNSVVSRYFEQAISANIHFTKRNYQILCDIVVNDGTGRHVVIKSDGASDEIYASFDIALVKAEKSLRKYKSKLKDRHNKIKLSETVASATKYTIAPYVETEYLEEEAPLTIAEKPIEIQKMHVNEALMKMDLENLPALMFQNYKTNRMNVVYYRRDGNIAWVDSK